MSTFAPTKKIVYPQSDGLPMADNTLQYEYIVTLQGGLDELIPDFVGANNFWYPVEGNPKVTTAPDVYVAFGRPKGHRPSYMQWEEGGIAPQVVFEILSPSNSSREMAKKGAFYLRHGVEEFYIFDPDRNEWSGLYCSGNEFVEVGDMGAWVSPRTGIRFDVDCPYMRVLRPDGEEFKSFAEIMRLRRESEQARRVAEQGRRESEQGRRGAEQGRHEAELRAGDAERANAILKERLRAAGIDPDA